MKYDNAFWTAIDRLVSSSEIEIDRQMNTAHPKYPDFIYPVDYGYLKDTSSMDGGGIDLWKGTNGDEADAIIIIVDLLKKDSEIKILIGCTEKEKELVAKTLNNSEYVKGMLIRREI